MKRFASVKLPYSLKRICITLFTTLVMLNPVAYGRATIDFINLDGPDEGFNDTTTATPVGGNTGVTLGEQRRIAFEYALNTFRTALSSDVTIEIAAEFNNLVCGDQTGNVLACAGPTSVHIAFSGAPDSSLHYPQALANKLSGSDQCTDDSCGANNNETDLITSDIFAEFNSSPPFGSDWYYGLDGNSDDTNFDFVTVALHELLHGFGFISIVGQGTDSEGNGTLALFSSSAGFGDPYTNNIFLVNGSPSNFQAMSDTQRYTAATSTPTSGRSGIPLRWNGSAALSLTSSFTSGVVDAQGVSFAPIYSPNPFEQGSSLSHVSLELTPNDLMEPTYNGANQSLGLGGAFLSDMGWGNYTDLTVNIIETFSPMPISSTSEYLLLVTNSGSQAANNTILEYTLPSTNTSFFSVTTSQGSCTPTNPTTTLTCDLGTVDLLQTVSVAINLTHVATGSVTHSATVYADIVDMEPSNNTNEVETQLTNGSASLTPNAGSDQTVAVNTTVTLDGSGSTATAGIATYSWNQIGGTPVTLSNADTASPTFNSGNSSNLATFALTITDSSDQSATDVVSVRVNLEPTSVAGSNQSVLPGAIVTLNGNLSSDSEGIASYEWSQTTGSSVTISQTSADSPTATFIAPSQLGTLEFSLTVTDTLGSSASSSITVNVSADFDSITSSSGSSGQISWIELLCLMLLGIINAVRNNKCC